MNLISSLFKGIDENQGLLAQGTNISINNKTVKIIEKIGEGGFATVYSAKDNDRKYAVKHCKCQSTEQIELIDNEINIMKRCATLDHPNIVSYYGTSKKQFESNEMSPRRVEYFILLEFMDCSLISYIKQHQKQNKIIPEKLLFELFLDIVNATYLLHAQNPPIAHRDIKIDNVLIKYIQTENNKQNKQNRKHIRLKLCDFGSCVDGTPKICHDTKAINIESEIIERFTTPSYRSPEMIDLYQRKELSTKVDVWALGCVLFLLAYYEHPFPEGAKMTILDAKYKIPYKDRYSKKVTKIFKMLFNKDPIKRPNTKQLSDHLCDIIAGGKGILSSKYKKRSNSNVMKTKLHLAPKQNDNINIRRKSAPTIKEEVKVEAEFNIDQEWDPFNNNDDNDDNNDNNDNNDDPFFSNDFNTDFFGDNNNNNNNENNIKPKPIDSEIYKRKKRKDKPSRSRSKSPKHCSNLKAKPQAKQRPSTPQPQIQSQNESSDPTVIYGEQLAQLISMGFNDSNKNIKAILRAKGNVQVAVNILITQ